MDGSKKLKSSRKHIGKKPFKCDVCVKAFPGSGDLVRHKRTHTGEKPFECDVCDKAFSQRGTLFAHKRTHTGEKAFKCDVCDKAFSLSSKLHRHKRIHTGGKPFKCLVCNKAFAWLLSLKLHSKTHDRENDELGTDFECIECNECNKKFSSPKIFDQHLLKHELEAIEPTGMEYFCLHCGETFDLAKKVQNHVNEAHILNKNGPS